MNSHIIKRSITVAGHKTSVSLEDAFWKALKEIAIRRQMRASDLVTSIDCKREHLNLSSCLRLFVLDYYRNWEAESAPPTLPYRVPGRAMSL